MIGRCATDYGIMLVGLPPHRQALFKSADLAPLYLAGLLFGGPAPLRWLPADARRMAIAGEFFWLAGTGQPPWAATHG